MKSICIKTNNENDLNYLLEHLNNIGINETYLSKHSFKHYKNIIIHHTGNEAFSFISNIANVLSSLVIEYYEDMLLNRLLILNYFYFDKQERDIVLEICFELLYDDSALSINARQNILSQIFYDYLSNHKTIILDGFINFRLKNYFEYLNSFLDSAVNQFIIEREYFEFISLLKIYINSEACSSEIVHLIYDDEHSILLDENKNIIDFDKNIFNAKYLSDITFSSNDYTLNTLLNILPKKIYIHLSNATIDQFINTLQLVFEDRVEVCTNE